MAFHVPNKSRIRTGPLSSDDGHGNNGAFLVKVPVIGTELRVVASDGGGWEHVSVSLPNRCPSWNEMCFVKAVFWDDDDCVVQFHPAKSQYVNNHKFCLHLWRPTELQIPTPPTEFVGVL